MHRFYFAPRKSIDCYAIDERHNVAPSALLQYSAVAPFHVFLPPPFFFCATFLFLLLSLFLFFSFIFYYTLNQFEFKQAFYLFIHFLLLTFFFTGAKASLSFLQFDFLSLASSLQVFSISLSLFSAALFMFFMSSFLCFSTIHSFFILFH